MHIGIIMDGNRTWAKQHKLATIMGHHAGSDTLWKILDVCPKYGIDIITLYAFSTENFQRSLEEVHGILNVIAESAKKFKSELVNRGTKIKILGNWEILEDKYRQPLADLVEATANCNNFIVQLCINYGGKDEIIRAIHKLLSSGLDLTEANVSANLDSVTDPELIIRTSGQKRLSNFLLWQSAYSELFFTDTLWPDFSEDELARILEEFKNRNRKFGK